MSINIPVVNISTINSKQGKIKLSKEIYDSCKEFGFFYITGHSIEKELIDKVLDYSKRYFKLPIQFKENFNKKNFNQSENKNEYQFGYYGIEQQKSLSSESIDYKEGIYLVKDDDFDDTSKKFIYPTIENEKDYNIIGFKETIEQFNDKCKMVCDQILELISISLNLPSNYFNENYSNPSTYVGLSKYPVYKNKETNKFGMNSHTDFGFITLLYQDQFGLQVKYKDQYIDVEPIDYSFVVNIGDLLQALTNGAYLSNHHRVLYNTKERDRYSIGFFYSPPWDVPIKVIQSNNKDGNTDYSDFDGITHRQYFNKRMGDLSRDL